MINSALPTHQRTRVSVVNKWSVSPRCGVSPRKTLYHKKWYSGFNCGASPFFVVLDNIRSLENVGAIFRTAEALGVNKIYLGGYSGVDQFGKLHRKLAKSALGSQNLVPFKHFKRTGRLIEKLKKQGVKIICLENRVKKTKNLLKFKPVFPLALTLGNETEGINKNILKKADAIVEIPMLGQKESFNVATAFGIAGFEINKYRTKNHVKTF